MNSRGSHQVEQAVMTLAVVTVCLTWLAPILRSILPAAVVIGVVLVVVRLVFFHTRRW